MKRLRTELLRVALVVLVLYCVWCFTVGHIAMLNLIAFGNLEGRRAHR